MCFRPIFTFEIYLPSERAFLFGAETSQAQRKWTEAIAKVFKHCIITLRLEKSPILGFVFFFCHTLEACEQFFTRFWEYIWTFRICI